MQLPKNNDYLSDISEVADISSKNLNIDILLKFPTFLRMDANNMENFKKSKIIKKGEIKIKALLKWGAM